MALNKKRVCKEMKKEVQIENLKLNFQLQTNHYLLRRHTLRKIA